MMSRFWNNFVPMILVSGGLLFCAGGPFPEFRVTALFLLAIWITALCFTSARGIADFDDVMELAKQVHRNEEGMKLERKQAARRIEEAERRLHEVEAGAQGAIAVRDENGDWSYVRPE